MKRFHVHVAVSDLEANVRFYSTVFGAEPTVQKPDYAKWMLEDPRVNFAISRRGVKAGLDHLGFEVDSDAELRTLRQQVAAAEIAAMDQPDAQCCYARSDKYWTTDPQGIAWETYLHPRRGGDFWRWHGPEGRRECSRRRVLRAFALSQGTSVAERSYNVLFLCTGNTARSVMAEVLLNEMGKRRFTAYSAGSHPKGRVHPLALELLQKNRLPTKNLRSKDWSEFAQPEYFHLHRDT